MERKKIVVLGDGGVGKTALTVQVEKFTYPRLRYVVLTTLETVCAELLCGYV